MIELTESPFSTAAAPVPQHPQHGPPDVFYKGAAEDGARFEVFVHEHPLTSLVTVYTIEDHDPETGDFETAARFPTMEELHYLAGAVCLPGGVYVLPPIPAVAGGELPRGWMTVTQLGQAGALPNTEAGRRALLAGGVVQDAPPQGPLPPLSQA